MSITQILSGTDSAIMTTLETLLFVSKILLSNDLMHICAQQSSENAASLVFGQSI